VDGGPVTRSRRVGSADLTESYATIEAALAAAGFPYRVAMFPNHLPELGEVVEVHAFDVSEANLLRVSQDLNARLAALRLHPMAIAMVFHEAESEIAHACVPGDAVWIAGAAHSGGATMRQ